MFLNFSMTLVFNYIILYILLYRYSYHNFHNLFISKKLSYQVLFVFLHKAAKQKFGINMESHVTVTIFKYIQYWLSGFFERFV